MTTRKKLGRLAAGASAMALLGVGFLGSAAFADTDPGNIDFEDGVGSITIHKYDGVEGAPGSGFEDENIAGDGLEGITFTLWKVNDIDLSDPSVWDDLEDMKAADVPEAGRTLVGDFDATDANGLTDWQNLELGVYYVEETDVGENNIVSEAPPFLVVLPMPADGEWLYDVHVYPKNRTDKAPPVKEVVDPAPGLTPGSTVTWTITKVLPSLQVDEVFTSVKFTDELDSRLTTDASKVSVTVNDDDATGDFEIDVTGQVVVVTAKTPADLKAGDEVVVTIDTTVTDDLEEILEGGAEIANDAIVNVNDDDMTTEEVAVYYGGIQVAKVDADTNETLAGAEFDVYAADAEGNKIGGPLNSDPLVTNEDGEFGDAFLVWVGDNLGDTQRYILVETQAPAGYVTPTGAAAEKEVTVSVGENSTVKISVGEVENLKQGVPDLPLTGAQGTILFTVIGLGLIGAGAAAIAVRRTRANN